MARGRASSGEAAAAESATTEPAATEPAAECSGRGGARGPGPRGDARRDPDRNLLTSTQPSDDLRRRGPDETRDHGCDDQLAVLHSLHGRGAASRADRCALDVERVIDLPGNDRCRRTHPRPQLARVLRELECYVVADDAACVRREHGDRGHLGGELFAGERIDTHRGRLADLDRADIGLADRDDELHRAEVGKDDEAGAARG